MVQCVGCKKECQHLNLIHGLPVLSKVLHHNHPMAKIHYFQNGNKEDTFVM